MEEDLLGGGPGSTQAAQVLVVLTPHGRGEALARQAREGLRWRREKSGDCGRFWR